MKVSFDAITVLNDVIAALKAGEQSVLAIFKLDADKLGQLADAATAKAATKTGYADIRLFLNRITWRAGELRKADKAPTHILRSRTSKGATTVYVAAYTYNVNKATATVAAATRDAAPASATGKAAPASADAPAVNVDVTVAALRAELDRVRAALDAERTAHAATRADLTLAKEMLAAITSAPKRANGAGKRAVAN